jgi:hypothetical protein
MWTSQNSVESLLASPTHHRERLRDAAVHGAMAAIAGLNFCDTLIEIRNAKSPTEIGGWPEQRSETAIRGMSRI